MNGSATPPTGNGHYGEFTPASSTPTLDLSCDRSNPDYSAPPTPGALWPHRLSASFSAMADQIAAASQALALVPSTAFSGSDVSAEFGALKGRLESIEKTQERLSAEFEALKTQFTQLETDRGPGLEELEKKISELAEIVKLDQQRLPARLHNSRATIMKASLKTPVAANGKPVAGFPATRGEFEHITKERYEALLKAYGQPLKGDTEAKRDALRTFAGIPQDGQ
ncbi:hypothetical protein BU15DRAFT_67063 [Melanogaster broomeanus]|nr:hypothetical protein BU15DRAFT_67063 [Melanogaster broomeanus]